jgi:hypothetical protein
MQVELTSRRLTFRDIFEFGSALLCLARSLCLIILDWLSVRRKERSIPEVT